MVCRDTTLNLNADQPFYHTDWISLFNAAYNKLEHICPDGAETGPVAKSFVKTHGDGGAPWYFVVLRKPAKPPLEFHKRCPHLLSMRGQLL